MWRWLRLYDGADAKASLEELLVSLQYSGGRNLALGHSILLVHKQALDLLHDVWFRIVDLEHHCIAVPT